MITESNINVLQKKVERSTQRSSSKMIAETTPQNIRDPIQSNLNKTPIFEDDPNYDADVTDDDDETEYEDEYEDESHDEAEDDTEDEYEDEAQNNDDDESQDDDDDEDESPDVADDEDKSPDVADDEDKSPDDHEDKSPDVADDEDKSPDVDDAEDKSPDVADAEDESPDVADAEDESPDVDDADDESEDDVVADDESQVDVEDKTPDEAEGEDEDEDNHEDAQEVDEETASETASDSEESKEINIQKPEPVSETESDSESDDNESVDVEAAMTQKELQKTDPTIVHTETNANFYYLSHKCEDSEHLTPKYTKEVPKEGINVILYLYTICDHHYMSPFVSLLLEYNVKESYYDFPQLLYTTDIQTDDIHDAILEKSLQKIYEIFDVKATEKVDTNLFQQKHICYKGLLEMNEDNVILWMSLPFCLI